MNKLDLFVKEKEEMLEEILQCVDYSQEEKESEANLLLTQSIKEASTLTLERVINYMNTRFVWGESGIISLQKSEWEKAISVLQKELSSIREVC